MLDDQFSASRILGSVLSPRFYHGFGQYFNQRLRLLADRKKPG
jgi:hypothetical protein